MSPKVRKGLLHPTPTKVGRREEFSGSWKNSGQAPRGTCPAGLE